MSASLSFTPSSLTKHIQHFTTKVQGAGGFPAGAALILVAKRRRSQSRELLDTRSSELLRPGSVVQALVSSDDSSHSFAGVVIARLQIHNSSEAD